MFAKMLATLVADDLSYLYEKHHILPSTQFGGRPARTTTDALHLLTQRVKNAWRKGELVSILFLDIQSAFPNVVQTRLIEDLKI